ncbi:MAG: hypothetical protein KKA79_05800 [Nanoarchaeota archaeon]|nr:hypothetical protein [Nanoarchaeota archaeon]
MVKVKYGNIYRSSFGKKEERIAAKDLSELLDKIEDRYKGKPLADKVKKYAMIMMNNKIYLNNYLKEDIEQKLTAKDEILITEIIGGG